MNNKNIIMELPMQQLKTRSYDIFDVKETTKEDKWNIVKHRNRDRSVVNSQASEPIKLSSRYSIFDEKIAADKEKMLTKAESKPDTVKNSRYTVFEEAANPESKPDAVKKSRYNIFETVAESNREKRSQKKPETTSKTRNIDVLDNMKDRLDEEREEKREYYSHIKFSKDVNAKPLFEVYSNNHNKYQKKANINNMEEFPSLGPVIVSTEAASIEIESKPVVKSAWKKL